MRKQCQINTLIFNRYTIISACYNYVCRLREPVSDTFPDDFLEDPFITNFNKVLDKF